MQNSMKKVIFGNHPHENMHGTKQCSNNLRTLSRVLMCLTNHHILNQARSWETRRDPHYYVMTDSGEALKVLLSTASAARWELLWANADFITKTTFLGLKDSRAAGLEHNTVTDCSSTSSRFWQDKEILFILTTFFCNNIGREGAWSFLLLKQHWGLSSALYCLNVYWVREIQPAWSESETNLSKWWHEQSLCVGGWTPGAELIRALSCKILRPMANNVLTIWPISCNL